MENLKFNIGDVMRLSFKWPQDAEAGRTNGSRDRNSVVFADENGTYSCSPISTVPPHKDEMAYAITLTPRLQSLLGLDPSRKSYLKANFVATVKPPNPAI